MSRIYHIARESRVAAAKSTGLYTPFEFAHDGFIHCSYARQLPGVAARNWSQEPWVLLEIDVAVVAGQLIDENLEGGADLYPHLYGALPLSAVVSIQPLTRNDAGQLLLTRTHLERS
jgi:uncharacterized protein (DUF952 family)